MVFSVALFFTVFLSADGAFGGETVVLILAGLLGGSLLRGLVHENLVWPVGGPHPGQRHWRDDRQRRPAGPPH